MINKSLTPVETNITSTQFETVKAHIDEDKLAHVLHLMRKQTYSDTILAVCREYIVNAIEVHQKENLDRPIDVFLPGTLEQTFIVRDYGSSLTKETLQKYFAGYGSSDKDSDNRFMGGLGIGCKSGFAYTDSFHLILYRDGIKYQFLYYLGSDNIGDLSLISEQPTDEENGLEVRIPVSVNDYIDFKNKVRYLSRYIHYPLNINGVLSENYLLDKSDVIKVFDNVYYIKDRTKHIVVIDQIPYDIDLDVKDDVGLIFKVSVGEVEHDQAREKILTKYIPFFEDKKQKFYDSWIEEIRRDYKDQLPINILSDVTKWKGYPRRIIETITNLYNHQLSKGKIVTNYYDSELIYKSDQYYYGSKNKCQPFYYQQTYNKQVYLKKGKAYINDTKYVMNSKTSIWHMLCGQVGRHGFILNPDCPDYEGIYNDILYIYGKVYCMSDLLNNVDTEDVELEQVKATPTVQCYELLPSTYYSSITKNPFDYKDDVKLSVPVYYLVSQNKSIKIKNKEIQTCSLFNFIKAVLKTKNVDNFKVLIFNKSKFNKKLQNSKQLIELQPILESYLNDNVFYKKRYRNSAQRYIDEFIKYYTDKENELEKNPTYTNISNNADIRNFLDDTGVVSIYPFESLLDDEPKELKALRLACENTPSSPLLEIFFRLVDLTKLTN